MLFDPSSPIYTSDSLRDKLWHLHGLLLCAAFLFLFPLGVAAIRSGFALSFRYHWLLQASASALALAGMLVGFATSKGIVLWHQYLGLALAGAIVLQGVAGWKHHVDFVRIRRRTWVSYVHLWLGRSIIGLAWLNVFWGLQLREYGWFIVGAALVAMGGMAALWVGWSLGWVRWGSKASRMGVKQRVRPVPEEEEGQEGLMRGADDFALENLEDEEDEDGDLAKGKGDRP